MERRWRGREGLGGGRGCEAGRGVSMWGVGCGCEVGRGLSMWRIGCGISGVGGRLIGSVEGSLLFSMASSGGNSSVCYS